MHEALDRSAWRASFRRLKARQRAQIEHAVRIGRAVDDSPLAPVAVEYARWTRANAEAWTWRSFKAWAWPLRYAQGRYSWIQALPLAVGIYLFTRDRDTGSIAIIVLVLVLDVWFMRTSLRRAAFRATQSEYANRDLLKREPPLYG